MRTIEKVEVGKIDFGKNDGKNEAEKENFIELFYNGNNNYEKLNNDDCFIITGYKGSGKTLLANYFSKNKSRDKGTCIDNLSAVDFMEQKLLSFSENIIGKEELTIFWKYVYLRNIGKIICKNVYKTTFYKFKFLKLKKIKKLENLLTEIQLIVDASEVSYHEKNELGISGSIGFSSNGTSIKGKLSGADNFDKVNKLKKKKYYELVEDLEKEIVKNVNGKEKIFVIYDDLDQLEEHMNLEEFLSLMKSMIYAADNLNYKFRKGNIPFRIIHVIRSDIKELMLDDSNNIQKVFSDFGVNIDWFSERQDNPYYHPLMKMLLHKIRNSVNSYKNFDDKDLYKIIFNTDEPILDFLLRNSFGRPREIIQLLLIFQEKYPKAKSISISLLEKCLPKYSEWLYGSVLSELKVQQESENIKKVIYLIQERGYKSFTYKKIEFYMNNNSMIKVDDLLSILRMMYKMGLIGVRNKNGSIQFSFRSNLSQLPREYTKFTTHSGLVKYLNLF